MEDYKPSGNSDKIGIEEGPSNRTQRDGIRLQRWVAKDVFFLKKREKANIPLFGEHIKKLALPKNSRKIFTRHKLLA